MIDTSSVLYRSFHALPELHNSQGHPTNALLGTMRCLESVYRRHPGAQMLAVMDSRAPSFRKELYSEYKANRSAMPDDLSKQTEAIDGILDARGIGRIRVDGMEADDLIASVIQQHRQEFDKIYVLTMDKDLAQLVDGRVRIIYGKDNVEMDEEAVQGKFAVNPGQIVDYLALLGDSSDNIPGVPGIGAKSAARILAGGRSLEEFVAQAGPDDKFLRKINAHREQFDLARKLIELKDDIDLPDDILAPPEPDFARLRSLYRRFELKSLLGALADIDPEQTDLVLEQVSASAPTPPGSEPAAPVDLLGFELNIVSDAAALQQMCAHLSRADLICLDTETSGLDYERDVLVGLSFAVEPGRVWYVPLAHEDPGCAQLPAAQALEALAPILNNPKTVFLGQNLKFDSNVLFCAPNAPMAIDLRGPWHDTMLQACLLKTQPGERVNLDALALKYMERENISYDSLIKEQARRLKKPLHQVNFSHIPVSSAAGYAAEDAVVCLRLHRALYPQIESSPWRAQTYHQTDIPLARVLARMERRGILVDKDKLYQAGQEFSVKIDNALEAIEGLAGRAVNPDSPKQLAELMFDQLQLPILSRTSTGKPSTDASVLERLAREFPSTGLPALVLGYRAARKLKSTYVDDLLERASGARSRVHTHFQQGVTLTGRLSSDSPNLQNIPVRSEDGLRIRAAFIAEQGWRLVSFDYSQVELRIIAHFSQDDSLVGAFRDDQDIHRFTAAEIFGIEPDTVDSHQRRVAKTINFGLVYGMTSHGLASRLRLSFQEAQNYIDMYFERYPGVREYMQQTRELARAQGYVESLSGRRIPIAHINDRNIGRRQHAERVAINAPVQGSGADIISRAMMELDKRDLAFSENHHLLLQVHDELLFEMRESEVAGLSAKIAGVMRSAADLRVPLEVNTASGQNWAQLSA